MQLGHPNPVKKLQREFKKQSAVNSKHLCRTSHLVRSSLRGVVQPPKGQLLATHCPQAATAAGKTSAPLGFGCVRPVAPWSRSPGCLCPPF
jgi:hypothetical protein